MGAMMPIPDYDSPAVQRQIIDAADRRAVTSRRFAEGALTAAWIAAMEHLTRAEAAEVVTAACKQLGHWRAARGLESVAGDFEADDQEYPL